MDPVDLAFAGIAEQARLIREKEISSRELVDVYLERIERIDPQLNAFREVFVDEARAAAEVADEKAASGVEAPLLGVPLAFKDELDMVGKVARHGTDAYDEPATANAVHVQRILQTLSALLVPSILIPLLAMPVLFGLQTRMDDPGGWGTMLLLLELWHLVITAHILRRALSVSLLLGLMLATGYKLLGYQIVGLFVTTAS